MTEMPPVLGYTRCVVHRCMSAAVQFPASVPLCGEHLQRMRDELLRTPAPPADERVVDAVVYYVTWDGGHTVKIGTTTSPRTRFKDLRRDGPGLDVLVAEPGHYELERRRHRQFRDLSLGNERFTLAGSLAQHIDRLKADIPDWPRLVEAVHAGRGGRRPVLTGEGS